VSIGSADAITLIPHRPAQLKKRCGRKRGPSAFALRASADSLRLETSAQHGFALSIHYTPA
jgi:hypothetical protein